MADTPFYHFALPAIGADQDSWGNKLNGNWSALDTLLHSISVGTGTFLPLTGGTITGNLSVNGTTSLKGTTVTGALGVTAGLTANTLGVSSTATIGNVTVTGTTTINAMSVSGTASFGNSSAYALYSSGTQRVVQFTTGGTFLLNTSDNQFYWNSAGAPRMRLDGAGNLYVTGHGYSVPGGPWGATSDERVKRNILPYAAGLDAVCRIRPIMFEFNGLGDTLDDGKIYYGVSAQHTQTIMPELVHELPQPARPGAYLPGQLGTQLGPLTLALVNAVRELRDRVLALEAERRAA